jgi:glucose/arabinose dehydrogenase
MKRNQRFKGAALAIAIVAGLWVTSCSNEAKEEAGLPAIPATGITVPDGFNASIVADSLGSARHIAITKEGNIYVKLGGPKDGKGTLMLTPSGAQAIVKAGFGDYGGTGVYVKDGYLYTSSTTSVFRYKLNEAGEVIDPNTPETIVSGLIDKDQHNSKSLVLDNAGNIYVNIGAPSNVCQEKDREKGSKGMQPCPILDSAGGIWRFKADVAGQTFKDGTRYATGLRNVVGLDWNQELNQLFVMQHGRDMLFAHFPELFDAKTSAELPAECLYALKEGDNAGWPYMYYDHLQKKKMQNPEFGGDGKKEATGNFIEPAAAFPGHLAPNGLLFYTGSQFPERYKNGAFIAFHGSWNRAPEPQAGFFVVFQPFVNGKPEGDWEVFADGFSGGAEATAAAKAARRPCGLAQGPDGALYVSDDAAGGIFKIAYGSTATASNQ